MSFKVGDKVKCIDARDSINRELKKRENLFCFTCRYKWIR